MRLNYILAAAAIAALTAGAAAAQSSDTSNGPGMNGASNPSQADQAGAPASGYDTSNAPSANQAGVPAAATVGDATLITNGPVPDTPENRAKYGKPMSNAGRHTAPAGN
jgi:hypothetical protein